MCFYIYMWCLWRSLWMNEKYYQVSLLLPILISLSFSLPILLFFFFWVFYLPFLFELSSSLSTTGLSVSQKNEEKDLQRLVQGRTTRGTKGRFELTNNIGTQRRRTINLKELSKWEQKTPFWVKKIYYYYFIKKKRLKITSCEK